MRSRKKRGSEPYAQRTRIRSLKKSPAYSDHFFMLPDFALESTMSLRDCDNCGVEVIRTTLGEHDSAPEQAAQKLHSGCQLGYRRHASTVFRRSIATVIGPTPPGTGVMWPATRCTSS